MAHPFHSAFSFLLALPPCWPLWWRFLSSAIPVPGLLRNTLVLSVGPQAKRNYRPAATRTLCSSAKPSLCYSIGFVFCVFFFFLLNYEFILKISADRQTDRQTLPGPMSRVWSSALLGCVGRNEAAWCRHVNSSVVRVGRSESTDSRTSSWTIPAFIGRVKFRHRKWTEA